MSRILQLQRLAFPLTCGQLAFALNGFVTHWFLAHSSSTAFHASLPGSMLAVAISSIFISSLAYSGTILAQRHGAGDTEGARQVFRRAIVLTILSAPLFLLAVPIGHFILSIFDTQPEVLQAESAYYDILLANGFFTALAAVLGGYFTGRGKTRLVGAMTTSGFILNMALSPIFINGAFGLPLHGIVGAGWAATIAHIVPCIILATLILFRHPGNLPAPSNRSPITYSLLLKLGLPNGIRSVIDIGGFFVFVAVLAECPPAAVAASTAAFAVNGIYQAFPQGLSAALEIVTARGDARNLRPALTSTAAYVALFALVLSVWGTSFLCHFRAKDATFSLEEFLVTARPLVLILAVKAIFESLVIVLQAHLKGLGRTSTVLYIQLFSSCCFWMPLYFCVRQFHPSIPLYWLTMIACSALSTSLLLWEIKFRTRHQRHTRGQDSHHSGNIPRIHLHILSSCISPGSCRAVADAPRGASAPARAAGGRVRGDARPRSAPPRSRPCGPPRGRDA